MEQKAKQAPAYLRLYHALRAEIVSGVYPYGARVPSKRTLAAEKGVSLVTAEHAYALLCEEGYLEARERSGYFVAFRLGETLAAAAAPAPPLPAPAPRADKARFPLSVLTKTMRRVMSEQGEAMLLPGEHAGCMALRRAIAHYLARARGIRVSPEQIVIGAGAEYLYGMLAKLFGRETLFALESPSYRKIAQVYAGEGVRCELLPLGHDGIESAALARAQAQVLHLMPYRSFPSGVRASASKRHEYLRWCAQGARFLIEDDFESEFSVSDKPEDTLFGSDAAQRVVFLSSFSMTVSPALRAAYLVLPEALLPRYAARCGFYACPVPVFEQLVLAELLDRGDFERHINRVRRAKRRALKQSP